MKTTRAERRRQRAQAKGIAHPLRGSVSSETCHRHGRPVLHISYEDGRHVDVLDLADGQTRVVFRAAGEGPPDYELLSRPRAAVIEIAPGLHAVTRVETRGQQ